MCHISQQKLRSLQKEVESALSSAQMLTIGATLNFFIHNQNGSASRTALGIGIASVTIGKMATADSIRVLDITHPIFRMAILIRLVMSLVPLVGGDLTRIRMLPIPSHNTQPVSQFLLILQFLHLQRNPRIVMFALLPLAPPNVLKEMAEL